MSRDDKISIVVVSVPTFHLFLCVEVPSQVRICGSLLQVCSAKNAQSHVRYLPFKNLKQLMPDIIEHKLVARF